MCVLCVCVFVSACMCVYVHMHAFVRVCVRVGVDAGMPVCVGVRECWCAGVLPVLIFWV